MAERQALFDPIHVSGMDHCGAAQVAAALGALGLRQVALARVGAQHLATCSDLEPLRSRFLGFDAFRTSHKSQLSKKERAI